MKAYIVSALFSGAETREVLGVGKSRDWAGDFLKKHLDTRHEAAFAGGEYADWFKDRALDELNEMKQSIDNWVVDWDVAEYYVFSSDARYWIEHKEVA